jgi:lipoprotein-anchoring transpeptidase ErfK/SrfK
VRRTRDNGVRIALFLVALLIGGAVAAVVVGARSGHSPAETALPASPQSALEPRNVPLGPRPTAYWAPVLAATSARPSPGHRTVVAEVPKRTPEGTANIVRVLGNASRRSGKLWVQVRVPAFPDDADAWMPRSALGGYVPVRTRLVVDRSRLTATLWRDDRAVFRARVGVGSSSTPTPPGDFYVRNRLERYTSPFYGPLAFGTSARSTGVSDWPAGGFVGIHGTNRPDLIPGRVSHGCIRMTNPDILRLARLMRVGTPLTVR